jgi:hypothetical protein
MSWTVIKRNHDHSDVSTESPGRLAEVTRNFTLNANSAMM